MTITTETGAGLANAESYASVAAADARCASLGLTAWAALVVICFLKRMYGSIDTDPNAVEPEK